MISKVIKISILLFPLFFYSCAVSYKPIKLCSNYQNRTEIDNAILIKYDTSNIFLASKNFRIARKSMRQGFQILPMYIYNNKLDTIIILNENTEVFCNYESAQIVDKSEYYKRIKQKVGYHGLETFFGLSMTYLLKASILEWTNPYNFLIVLGVYNIYKASKANKQLLKEIEQYDVLNKKIAPGDSLNGFICLRAATSSNLMFRIKKIK